MADYTVNIDLPDHKRGDRWPGIPVGGPVIINELQPVNALIRIRWHFVHRGSKAVYRMDSDASEEPDAPIVISNATTWEWNVPKIQNFLPTGGKWDWDAEFYEECEDSPLSTYEGVIFVNGDTTRTQR